MSSDSSSSRNNIYPSKDEVYDWLDSLSLIEREVIELRYGLHYQKKHSSREVADILESSWQKVSQIEKTALKKFHKGGGDDFAGAGVPRIPVIPGGDTAVILDLPESDNSSED